MYACRLKGKTFFKQNILISKDIKYTQPLQQQNVQSQSRHEGSTQPIRKTKKKEKNKESPARVIRGLQKQHEQTTTIDDTYTVCNESPKQYFLWTWDTGCQAFTTIFGHVHRSLVFFFWIFWSTEGGNRYHRSKFRFSQLQTEHASCVLLVQRVLREIPYMT